MANPANQLISEKLPKWHFLTYAWNLFWAKWLHLKCFRIDLSELYLASSKCLSKRIKLDKLDYFQNGSQDFFSLLYSIFYILILIYFFKHENIVRSRASSFGQSDPDPSKINLVLNDKPIRRQDFEILIDFQTLMQLGNWLLKLTHF